MDRPKMVFRKVLRMDGLLLREERQPCVVLSWRDKIATVRAPDGEIWELRPEEWS